MYVLFIFLGRFGKFSRTFQKIFPYLFGIFPYLFEIFPYLFEKISNRFQKTCPRLRFFSPE